MRPNVHLRAAALALTIGAVAATTSLAAPNKCRERVRPGYYVGKCSGRALPVSKTRNLDFDSFKLECSSNSDQYVRRAFPLAVEIYYQWRNLEIRAESASSVERRLEIRKEMQKLRQANEPPVIWSGVIPYSTVEKWSWQECVLDQDGGECGYHEECHWEDEPYTDKKGKQRTRKKKVCVDVANYCHFDRTRYESLPCSDEKMTYTAEYVRPNPDGGPTEWNPSNPLYKDSRPSYHDLFPGEVEVIQTFNTTSSFLSGNSEWMKPESKINDAWNDYDVQTAIRGVGDKAPCVKGANYQVDVKVLTKGRVKKVTPNAFRVPVDHNGKEIDPLEFQLGPGDDKKTFRKAKPQELKLTDASSLLMNSLTRQNRTFAADMMALQESRGTGTNITRKRFKEIEAATTKADPDSEESGFWKDTQFRIQLYESPRFEMRRIYRTREVKGRGAGTIQFKDVNYQDQYRVKLISSNPSKDLYGASSPVFEGPLSEIFNIELRPGRHYDLEISMYQKGLKDLYVQGCEVEGGFDCWPVETRQYWSKPLVLSWTQDDQIDLRKTWQKVLDWQGQPFYKKPFSFR